MCSLVIALLEELVAGNASVDFVGDVDSMTSKGVSGRELVMELNLDMYDKLEVGHETMN